MKLLLRILLVAILIPLTLSSFAQVRKAKQQMSLFKYSKAVTNLKKATQSDDPAVKAEANRLLADCYRLQNNIPAAKEYYGKLVESGSADAECYYYYGQALRSMGEYPKAREMFLKYQSMAPGNPKGALFASYCDSAMSWQSLPPLYEIKPAESLNTEASDFSPVFYRDGVIFASDRSHPGVEGTYKWTGRDYIALFYSGLKKQGDLFGGFEKPVLKKGLFSEGYHSGPITFDKKYSEVFINITTIYKVKGRKGPEKLKQKAHLLKIFSGTWKKNKFTDIKPFFLNSDSYSVGHPALNPQGDILYFISDMPGGYGGTDIWYCKRNGSQWSNAVNLGPRINTPENEMFPYIAESGDLYFASGGLPGMGGLDLYVARKQDTAFTAPENLMIPINTSADDFGIALYGTSETGLFSTTRSGGKGNDDLYLFKRLPPPPPPPAPPLVFLSGCVKDKTTGAPVPGATLFLLDNATGFVRIGKADESGCFRVNIDKGMGYTLKAVHPGFIADCMPVRFEMAVPEEELTASRTLLLEPLVVSRSYRIENIYYDFDKAVIRDDAKPSLDNLVTIMKENPIQVELGSFTDCRGSDEYNQKLSQKRAESAVSYIVGKGIGPGRITAKGYGESQPVNDCNCKSGKKCTPDEYAANRRTEFRVISTTAPMPAETFDASRYKAGDMINMKDLPEGFFGNCK